MHARGRPHKTSVTGLKTHCRRHRPTTLASKIANVMVTRWSWCNFIVCMSLEIQLVFKVCPGVSWGSWGFREGRACLRVLMVQNPNVYISSWRFLISWLSRETLIDRTKYEVGTEDMPDGFMLYSGLWNTQGSFSRDTHACGNNPLARVHVKEERAGVV